MFDDQITQDENYLVKTLHDQHPDNGHVIIESTLESLSKNVGNALDDFLSKDSSTFRYNYGRLNGMVPEKSTYFHNQFPRKSTNLDSEYHHTSLDADILSRWIPRSILKIFVPILYFQDLQKEQAQKRLSRKRELDMEYHMTARPVPTLEELNLCASFRGKGVWDRNGTWFCTSQDVSSTPYKQDEFGPKIFKSYNSWITWESNIQNRIEEAKRSEDWDLVKSLRRAKNPPPKM
ncbi:predicted protein [Scheffersomyces stipitis CBS 6054]|uniref:Uncharacterized protein n=1 Tax=Scheffersomyces stipitis (strain ATCC 58785 / CBS 6054 / NBRC 10063 / NRRL Y-11545) TaxID=322104 RepID=A3LTJ5_PICST|nr:predicted protein [Scheffersomyces stipitis CBS 6054]ABN66079.2 predicted protein [Scheffersomyces stipitis CBS 6054]KAG2732824.1 hypothetical protein G9P44_003814 [Scheffersomyces stipitis]